MSEQGIDLIDVIHMRHLLAFFVHSVVKAGFL
jgi:hypothetical protein